MRKSHSTSYLLSLLVVAAGCGRSEDVTQIAGSDPQVDVSWLPVSKESPPGIVVSAFLDALRGGDHEVAQQLLTTTAREQTAANNMPLQAPGSPTASYSIGETTRIDGGVQVGSRWTERLESGEKIVYEIDWVLRQRPEGWRVAGMSTSFTPNGELVYVNFEDVEDMLKKWDDADEEIARQQDAAAALPASQTPQTRRR